MAVTIDIAARQAQRESFWTDRRRTLAVIALLVTGTGAAVMGTISAFTSAPTKAQTVTSGTFVFNLADPGAGAPFGTSISGMAPGDFADRLVNVTNTGTIGLASVALSATAGGASSLLDTDATDGLALQIDHCSAAWVQASNAVAATCPGGATLTNLTPLTPLATLISSGPSYASTDPFVLASLSGGGTDRLRFHYELPSGFANTTGLTSTVTYTFTATQRAGGVYH